MKCEILATQVREHVTHREAAERVHERFAQEGKSFSAAAIKEPTYKKPRIAIKNKPISPNTEIAPIADPASAPAPTPAPASACSTLATNVTRTDKLTSLTPVISSIYTDMSVPSSTHTLAIIQPAVVTSSATTTQTLPLAVTENIQT